MDAYAQQLVTQLQQQNRVIAVAESLTGGRLADSFVNVPGASPVFLGGIVTYATESKSQLLGVSSQTLSLPAGPIQADVSEQMAEGVYRHFLDVARSRSLVTIATTGVAGPDTSYGQDVGTVFISVRCDGVFATRQLSLSGDRSEIRDQTVKHALKLALEIVSAE